MVDIVVDIMVGIMVDIMVDIMQVRALVWLLLLLDSLNCIRSMLRGVADLYCSNSRSRDLVSGLIPRLHLNRPDLSSHRLHILLEHHPWNYFLLEHLLWHHIHPGHRIVCQLICQLSDSFLASTLAHPFTC